MSRRAIPGNFFWGEISEKVIEIKKMDLSAFKFVIVYKPAFTTTKRSICGTEKTFLEKTSSLFFFVRQLGAGCPIVFRRTILEKLFSGQEEKKNWHLSDIFSSPRPNCSLGCVKYSIPHQQMNNLQEKNSEKFFTFYICFRAWRTK